MTSWKTAVITAMAIALLAAPAMAEQKIIDLEISDITVTTDRNNNPYTRIIVEEPKNLKGVEYTIGVPVMVFGEDLNNDQKVKALQEHGRLKALVDVRQFQGRDSYTLIKVLE